MLRFAALALLFAAPVVAGQDYVFPKKERYKVRALDFEVAVPDGWERLQDHAGMVARDKDRIGFTVSREPLLHEPKEFADAWAAQLSGAKLTGNVASAKAGKYKAWRAGWQSDAAGGRTIEVWRLHVPEVEMLYNFSFSAAKGTNLKPLTDGVFKSFKCTAPKAAMKFQQTAETVSTRISITLPQGYAKEARGRGISLGGGLSGGFVKVLSGYKEPHVAGRIMFREYDAGTTYITPSQREIPGTNVKGLIEETWRDQSKELGEVVKKPRGKAARYGGTKGYGLEARVLDKNGLPKYWFAYGGKHKQKVIEITMLVDAREVRLHKNFFRQICQQIKARD